MKVLAVGGGGFIGSHLCRELQSRGYSVTVTPRSSNSENLPGSVEKAMGDVTDYDSATSAFEGRGAVVSLVALSPLFEPSGGNRVRGIVHWQGTEDVMKAAEANDVPRLVQMSALGVDSDGNMAYIRSKGKVEGTVRSSGLDWVISRPSVVFGDDGGFVPFTRRLEGMFASGILLCPLSGNKETRFQPIWVGNLVPMPANAVGGDDHTDETYHIGNPEKLTLHEITEMVYGTESKSITIVPLPMGLTDVDLTVLGTVPSFPTGKDQYRSLQPSNAADRNDAGVLNIDTSLMKTLDAYLDERNRHRSDNSTALSNRELRLTLPELAVLVG